jgi:hypothetical protein
MMIGAIPWGRSSTFWLILAAFAVLACSPAEPEEEVSNSYLQAREAFQMVQFEKAVDLLTPLADVSFGAISLCSGTATSSRLPSGARAQIVPPSSAKRAWKTASRCDTSKTSVVDVPATAQWPDHRRLA